MSFTKARASIGALRNLPRTSIKALEPIRLARPIQCRWESTKPPTTPAEQSRSFKGQLYDSTAERLQREREEQKKFARDRNESAGGSKAAMTFGTTPQSAYTGTH